MIDLDTLGKLKIADKALSICRLELCKPMNRKRLNFSRLYNQHQIGWNIVEEILTKTDPAYMTKKRNKARERQRKWLENYKEKKNGEQHHRQTY